MLNLLATVLFALTPADSTFFHVDVVNNTKIEKVGGRDITFGVKETVEEYIIEQKGYSPKDSSGFTVTVYIDSVYSPQQMLNIMGIQWLRKDYIVETTVCIGSGCFKGKGERRTFIFAMFLNVENGEVPLIEFCIVDDYYINDYNGVDEEDDVWETLTDENGNPLTDMGDYSEYDKRILNVVKSDWPDYDLEICEFPWDN